MNWLWVVPAIGALFLVIAAWSLPSRLSFESDAVRTDGEVVGVVQSSRIDNDGRRWTTWCFDSEDLWFDPAPYLDPEIRVLVDPKDASRYWVDAVTLPEMA